MRPEEVRAVSRLAAKAYSGTVANIEQAHLQIAAAAFGHVPLAAPAAAVHHAVTRSAYGVVRRAGSAIGVIAGEVLPLAGAGTATPVGSTTTSNQLMAALNAAVGDRLAASRNPLAIQTSVRAGGSDLAPERAALEAAYPAASPKIAVFVHGLGETEASWGRPGEPTTYGARLEADLGFTAVYVRYNTGRHISHAGRELARLLDDLVAEWPCKEAVKTICLIGHSMGGLVIRSATHYAKEAEMAFTDRVRDVFTLGSPHLGAPLARFAHFAGWALDRARQPVPFGTVVTERSAGIDDLRHGYLTDEDWGCCDDRACRENHRRDIPLLASANHYTISATVTRDPGAKVGQLVGDLLVQPASAHGRRRAGTTEHVTFLPGTSHELGGRTHFHLLHDPEVYMLMRERLTSSQAVEPRAS